MHWESSQEYETDLWPLLNRRLTRARPNDEERGYAVVSCCSPSSRSSSSVSVSFAESADRRKGLAAKRRKRNPGGHHSADSEVCLGRSFCASCAFSRLSRLPGVDISCTPIVEPDAPRQCRLIVTIASGCRWPGMVVRPSCTPREERRRIRGC